MAKEVEYSIGPFTGIARNKTLARENAEQQIRDAYKVYPLSPILIVWHEYFAIVYRHMQCDCWSSEVFWPGKVQEILTDDPTGTRLKVVGVTHHGTDDLEEVVNSVKYHLIQTAWDDSSAPTREQLDFLSESNRFEFLSYCRWQLSCKAAQEAGLDMNQARRYADNYGGQSVDWFVTNVLEMEKVSEPS